MQRQSDRVGVAADCGSKAHIPAFAAYTNFCDTDLAHSFSVA